jgi:hypothetical protein
MNLTRLAEVCANGGCECNGYRDAWSAISQGVNGIRVIWSLICEAWFMPGRPFELVNAFWMGLTKLSYIDGYIGTPVHFVFWDQGQGSTENGVYRPASPEIIKACAFLHFDSIWYAIPMMFIYAVAMIYMFNFTQRWARA